MKKKLCILHWMPVEYFPPAINTANYFAEQNQWDVSLCTNQNHLGRKEFSHESVKTVRGNFPAGKLGLRRILDYCLFQLKALSHLVRTKPEIILYIEPHSALPVFLSRLVNRHPKIFIHYHEYHSPVEFEKPGMRMARWSHYLERKWLYPVAEWVSQTNESRLKLFFSDIVGIDRSKGKILPNYPPRLWGKGENRAWSSKESAGHPVRYVYVGALSRVNTFIEEAIDWIKNQGPGLATLDVYSYNLHEETLRYLQSAADEQVRFHHDGVPYDELPQLLRDFHVGLILYKGNTPNYAHNASNKLFEYLACGLDVIYPEQMLGVNPYATMDKRPRVIECDFSRLSEFVFHPEGRQQLPTNDIRFYCESELEKLENAMLNSLNA